MPSVQIDTVLCPSDRETLPLNLSLPTLERSSGPTSVAAAIAAAVAAVVDSSSTRLNSLGKTYDCAPLMPMICFDGKHDNDWSTVSRTVEMRNGALPPSYAADAYCRRRVTGLNNWGLSLPLHRADSSVSMSMTITQRIPWSHSTTRI